MGICISFRLCCPEFVCRIFSFCAASLFLGLPELGRFNEPSPRFHHFCVSTGCNRNLGMFGSCIREVFCKYIPMPCVFSQTCPSCGITFAPKSEAGAEGGTVQNGCQDEPKTGTKVTSSWLLFLSVPLLAHPPKVTFLSRQLLSSQNSFS